MDLLTKALLEDLLDTQKTVAIYGGGFKPPTKGHFTVAKLTLEQFPEIDELKIFVGGGVRDGITQDESIKIWDIYKKYLSPKVDVEPSVAPVKSVLGYAKENPDTKVYWILGARDGDEGDLADIENRTKSLSKYPNLKVKVITTSGGVSGTKTRQAVRDNNKEQFFHMIPDVSDAEKEEIWNMVSSIIKEGFMEDVKTKFQKFIAAIKQEGQETKEVVGLLIHAAQGKIELTDKDKEYIGNQLKDVLKTIGLVGIATLPGGFIAGALIKLFKAEHLVTPSAFVNEVGEANLKPYKWEEIRRNSDWWTVAGFTTDSETQYVINLKITTYIDDDLNNYKALDIDFTAKPKDKRGKPSYKIVVNKGELYKVMSTITDIIKHYVEKFKAKAITYSPSKKSSEEDFGTQRDNLYKAFISKAIPDIKFKKDKESIVAILPDTQINEVGEANLKPYKWEEVDREGYYVYTRFTTDSETQYDVDIKSTVYFPAGQMESRPALEIEFTAKPKGAEGSSAKIVVNKGEMYRVMATIVDIIKKYLKKSKAQAIIYSPSKKSSEENFGAQRDNLYRAFISKAIPGVTFKQSGDFITAILPSVKEASDPQAGTALPYGSGFAPVKELVTDTEVICDNCGWEWSIKDGGKDLYICHKCGHDNTPKSDDPFGLNELARQFLKEALIETWNPEESFVSLSRYMIDNGMNIKPLPKIKVIKDDKQNASDLLGKTAYYNPVEKSITLYTMDRHPKDVLRSFAHEMIHHEQNLEGRLNNINTTNTNEDGDLPEIEKEAYEKGNMMLRNWEDSIKNNVDELFIDIPKFNYPKTLEENLWHTLNEITLNPNNAVEITGDVFKGMFQAGNKVYTYDIKSMPNPYKEDLGLFYNISFTPKDDITSKPLEGKENYIKILSTMYKIILDFAKEVKPEYIGIASLDNDGSKNYHKVYANLTNNKSNNIPGYFRKDVGLTFKTKDMDSGRIIVLKRKDV
jgi:hypothetical protein